VRQVLVAAGVDAALTDELAACLLLVRGQTRCAICMRGARLTIWQVQFDAATRGCLCNLTPLLWCLRRGRISFSSKMQQANNGNAELH
jgi:hypothetical protein